MTWKNLSYLSRTNGNDNKTPCSQEFLLCNGGDGPSANKGKTHRALDSDNVEKTKPNRAERTLGVGRGTVVKDEGSIHRS